MSTSPLALLLLACGNAWAEVPASQPAPVEERVWVFNSDTRWAGWTPNSQIQDVRFETEGAAFRTAGSDPILVGPVFHWPSATNAQHVEIDIDCEAGGEGELYFTNTASGPNEGFQGQWYVPVAVPGPGRQVVPVWPFWETLGQVVRIRFDPPSGIACRLHAVRIVHDERPPATPAWDFGPDAQSWQSMYAAQLKPTAAGLQVRATRPMALAATATEPFDAGRRSLLRLSASCPGEQMVCLYWANREESGLWGEPIELPADNRGLVHLDLRQFPEWRGTITNLAVGFGTNGGEVLTLRSLAIGENDVSRSFLRLRYFGYADGVGRPDRPVKVRAILEHAWGLPISADEAELRTDENAACSKPRVVLPALTKGQRADLCWTIRPRRAGAVRISLLVNGQTFVRELRVDPAVDAVKPDDYDVPEPRPVASDNRIGVYYYPGWSDAQMQAWQRQADLPERDPLLGWYREGRPEVADWHIKWAVENGISFFVYDWYWREGREHLGAALNEGLLKARYADRIRFAVMWANHKPFAAHTHEQLLTVTDYWIERYLRRKNYLTVDGKPYVSFYSPSELLECLGSACQVRQALNAMRDRAKAAGLAGLHIAAVDIPGQVEPAALKEAGFDSLTAYTYTRTGPSAAHSLYRAYLAGYPAKWERASAGGLPYVPALAVGWDGPVWYGPRSERRRGRRTAYWAEGLGRLKAFLDQTGGRMALLEAWNEWGEGAYLEPNVEFGFADLEAVRSAFARPGDWPRNLGPQDIGLSGKYDARQTPAADSPPAPDR